MGEITETRSQETGYHVKRVAEYSRLLALKYGLSEEVAEIIRLASPMHDVGKVGIPDAILNKPGKLTAEEFEIIKTHAKLGHEMLKHSSKQVLNAAAIIALQHHEKYDGTGYPSNLKGEEIHIYGRITALADVFDALCSDRVYKKAWELDRVLELLKEERGKHFDPQIVDIFLNHKEEFLQIKEMYQ
ncbi:Cyclic di-GMP phosphodiesterase response regulator RpfG [compost metagenome]